MKCRNAFYTVTFCEFIKIELFLSIDLFHMVIFVENQFQMAILYFFAQLFGAVIGYRCLLALTPLKVVDKSSGSFGFCATAPHEDVTEIEAFVLEFVATMVLITLCCGVWDHRNSKNQDSVPLKFGLAIFILSVIFVSSWTFCFFLPKIDLKFKIQSKINVFDFLSVS